MNRRFLRICIVFFMLMMGMTACAPAEQDTKPFEEQDAILGAHHLMTEVYDYDADVADTFRYEVCPGDEGFEVRVYPFPEMEEHFTVVFQTDGTLLDAVKPEILDFSAYDRQVYESHKTFFMYTLEEKAAYSEEYIPKVEALLRLKPDYDGIHYHYTRSRYGLPGEDDLPEERAWEIAKQAAMDRLALDADWFDEHVWHQTFFDVTDPACTLWKFYIGSNRPGKGKYVIRLNSKTGDVVKAFEYTGDMPLWEAL